MVVLLIFLGMVALLLPATLIQNVRFLERLRNEQPVVWENLGRPQVFFLNDPFHGPLTLQRFLRSPDGLLALPDPSLVRLGKSFQWLRFATILAWLLLMWAMIQLNR